MKNAILGFGVFLFLSIGGLAHATTEWNAQDYDLYAGDFDGDGKTDILYVAKDPSMPSGIARSDGTGPNIAWQSWASNFLGINWSGNAYNVIVADFNGDGKADIFLQSVGPGNSYLLLTSNTGLVVGISQTIANGAMGLTWSADQHHIVAGDFNGDHKADLVLQATSSSGTNAVVLADSNGMFTSASPAQTWSDGYLGFKWSTVNANVFAGDFNGDGRTDLLIQAKPNWIMINYDVPFPVPTYPPNMNGVVLAQTGATPFTAVGTQAWSRMSNGVDWSPLTNNIVIATDGSGKSEVILQAKSSAGTSYELTGNATGAIFPATATALTSNVSLSASSTRLIAANFAGGHAAGQVGLFFQALTAAGTNYTTTSVGATITANSENPGTVTGTVEASSAGRTAGQFSITPTGAAAYNIPIWTPPGIREIEPHIALHYTSGGPDGVMGPGWSLSGVSAIARCGKTWVSTGGTPSTVGSPVGVMLSTNDDLCIDGNRMRLIAGTQGMGGSIYMTELADFSLITANGVSTSPLTSFTIQGKDGKNYEYGNTGVSPNSQVRAASSPAPYAWALDKVTDRQSNGMVYAYNAGVSTLSLSNIQYTATPGSTTSGFKYQVSFNYASARAGGTTITKYVAGGTVTQSQQLSNIQVYSLLPSSTLVRQYNLGYSVSPTTNRPLLSSMQECGGASGTDCIRPTTIVYQSGAAALSTTPTSTGLTGQYGFIPIDLNGDGIPDALYGKFVSGSTVHWYARIATTSGYGSEIDTGATTSSPTAPIITGTFTGKSSIQFLAPVSTTWNVYTYVSGAFTHTSIGVQTSGEQMAVDWDGDGLPDLVSFPAAGNVVIRRNVTAPGGAVTFAATTNTLLTGTGYNPVGSQHIQADFNGDGRGDFLVAQYACGNQFPRLCFQTDFAVISNGFAAPPTSVNLGVVAAANPQVLYNVATVDWNGDGCSDIVAPATSGYTIYISNCAGGFTAVPTGVPNAQPYLTADWDGDGQTDLIYTDATTSTWYVMRSTGNGVASAVPTGIPAPNTKSFFFIDQNSDGQPDLMYSDSANGYAVGYYPHSGVSVPPDLVSGITDGFGINFSPTYVAISQSSYTKGSTASFPDEDFQGPLYVVNQFSASDGTGGTYQTTFTYSGARLNLQGRGFEGFATTTSTDSRNGLVHSVAYSQGFPSIGAVLEDDTFQTGGIVPISKTSNSYFVAQLVGSSSGYSMPGSAGASAACPISCYSYVSGTTINSYELGAHKNGQLVSSAVTNYTFDPYGTLSVTNSTLTDQDSGIPISPFNGQSWVTKISNSITNYPSTWCLGRPNSTTSQKTAPGQPVLTRTVNHTIDSTNCRATVEILEPNDPLLKVSTTFGFDGCGNTNSVSVVGLDETGAVMPARTTLTDYNYYSGRCQFPESVTNPYSQVTYVQYRFDLGVKQKAIDANNVAVNWVYDDFGRKTSESRPDLTSTRWNYVDCVSPSCWGTSDLRLQATETLVDSSGSAVRLHEWFSDGLDRVRYDEGNRVLGIWNTQVTTYDSLGRKNEVDLPYSASGNGFHVYTYDVGNRPLTDALYTSAGVQYRQIQMAYMGQTATVTDPNGHIITKVTDVASKLRWVTDPPEGLHGAAAGTTKYTYDSFGDLVTLVDAIGATSRYVYNIHGFKIGSTDADTGNWTYQPDSLNELKVQTDANHAVTKFTYDLLGRMIGRLEPEAATSTSWVYGTNAAIHEIGQLNSVSKPDGYAENYTYDGLGRLQTKKYTEDATTYQFDYAYNGIGAPDTLTYPTSTLGVRFQLKYAYDSAGYLNEVKDASAGTPFWTLLSTNDNGAPTTEVLGNTVSVVSGYTPWTNEIVTRTEGSGNSTTNLQNLSYSWDLNGNLLQRVDNAQNLTEKFTLDWLNRLSTVTLFTPSDPNGTQTLSVQYDQAGDITNKSDVGSYTYGNAAHPHAVTAAGPWTVGYDLNGNMNSRAGGAITSYSYNLPNQINYNGSSSQFNYDASHQRWKQVANYAGTTETVHYIGGLLQIVNRGTSPTEYRHQIPTGSGTAVYTRRADGTSATFYATSDHLGSADLVTDVSGNVLVRESFTPFGARRASNWQSTPSQADYTAIQSSTRQGFTGHEMLDSVGLIHMNGRVYDPTLGRFLSADTVIQSLGASQSVNPYAYAWNDPLTYVDPSGHNLLGAIVGIIVAIIVIYFTGGTGASLYSAYFDVALPNTVLAGFVGGFAGALVSTGSLSAALTAGAIGALTAGLFSYVGQQGQNLGWDVGERTLAHAAVGCVSGQLSSGNCGKGALAAAASEYLGSQVLHGNEAAEWGSGEMYAQTAKYALIGGLASRISGGSFEEGFSLGAAGYLFNEAADHAKNSVSLSFTVRDLLKIGYDTDKGFLLDFDPTKSFEIHLAEGTATVTQAGQTWEINTSGSTAYGAGGSVSFGRLVTLDASVTGSDDGNFTLSGSLSYYPTRFFGFTLGVKVDLVFADAVLTNGFFMGMRSKLNVNELFKKQCKENPDGC